VSIRRRGSALTLAGVLVVLAAGALDLAGAASLPISAYGLGPLFPALAGAVAGTIGTAVLALALAIADGLVNDRFRTGEDVTAVFIIAAFGVVAVAGALAVRRAAAASRRLEILAALAEVGGDHPPSETAQRLCDLAVPVFADGALMDVAVGDEVTRLAVGPIALFNLGAVVASVGLAVVFTISAIRNTRALYEAELLPTRPRFPTAA
jgi:hypothetical protein